MAEHEVVSAAVEAADDAPTLVRADREIVFVRRLAIVAGEYRRWLTNEGIDGEEAIRLVEQLTDRWVRNHLGQEF